MFSLRAGNAYRSEVNFGTQFPNIAAKGDIFVRVDVMPNKVFKFDGQKWIERDKEKSDTYLYDIEYIKYLVEQIERGIYDTELLTPSEEEQIKQYLNGKL